MLRYKRSTTLHPFFYSFIVSFTGCTTFFKPNKLKRTGGVHHSQIGRYEKGEASPSAEVLKKMANALDASTDYLMNGTTTDLAAENINDKTLINQFNRIAELSTENKSVVSKLIDAFLFQQEMKQKLAQ
jgi:transcriptional regulator with XRE-family HTH domain